MPIENSDMPELISVIIPVYNTEKYLEKCIDSILDQTYRNIELILVVDDGSTDMSSKICDEYKIKDERIKVIHKDDKGVTSARKAGLLLSKGEYISFIDSDDWLEPEMYESLLSLALKTGSDIVTSGVIMETGEEIKKVSEKLSPGVYECDIDGIVQNNAFYWDKSNEQGIHWGLWNKLFRREVVYDNVLALDDRIIKYEDLATVVCAILDSEKICVSDDFYYHHIDRKGSLTYRQDLHYLEMLNVWYLYMRNMLANKEHAAKLEDDVNRHVVYGFLEGTEYFFNVLGDHRIPKYVIPRETLPKGRIVLYGAGRVGQSYYLQLKNDKRYSVVGWVDKTPGYRNQLIKGIEALDEIKYDFIIIAVKSEFMAKEIRNELKVKGVSEEVIIWKEPVYVIDYIKGLY